MSESVTEASHYEFAKAYWGKGLETLVESPEKYTALNDGLGRLLEARGAHHLEADFVGRLALDSILETRRTLREKGEL